MTNDAVIALPGLPSGLTARAATRRDLDAIVELVAACELAIDGVIEVDPGDIAQAFDLTASEGDVLVIDDASGVVAWATVADGRAEADVHPEHLDRGLGAAVLRWTEDRTTAAGRTRVYQVVTDANAAAHRLFERHGYATFQTSWILEKTLDETPPTVVVPAGIVVRPYETRDAPAVYRVIEDAFNEWPGREPSTFEKWTIRILDHVGVRARALARRGRR